MAGLLDDWLYNKDENQETAPERLQPLWGGLIKAGLLSVAGGGNLMPEQRAQYIAKAGDALGDIPGGIVARKSELAKQKLSTIQGEHMKSQIASETQKREQQAKMDALTSDPEFMKKLQAGDKSARIALGQIAMQAGHYDVAMKALNPDKYIPLSGGNFIDTERGMMWSEFDQKWIPMPGHAGGTQAPPPAAGSAPAPAPAPAAPSATTPPVVTPPVVAPTTPPVVPTPAPVVPSVDVPTVPTAQLPQFQFTPPSLTSPPPVPPELRPGPTAAPAVVGPPAPTIPQVGAAPPALSPYGNQRFGGLVTGGNTFGGNRFGGQTFGASAAPPPPPPPTGMPLPVRPTPQPVAPPQVIPPLLQANVPGIGMGTPPPPADVPPPVQQAAVPPAAPPVVPAAAPPTAAPPVITPQPVVTPPQGSNDQTALNALRNTKPEEAVTRDVGSPQAPNKDVPIPANPNINMDKLNAVPERWRATVLALIEGRQGLVLGKNRERLMALAHNVDPTWNTATYGERVKWANNLAVGPVSQLVRNTNTFVQHAGNYEDTADKLNLDNGFKANLTNPAKVLEMRANRDPRMAAVDTATKPVLSEFAAIMKGAGPTSDFIIKEYNDKLVAAQTPQERHAVLAEMVDLMNGRLLTISDQHASIMGHEANPNQFLFPRGQKTVDRLKGLAAKDAEDRARAAAATAQPGGGGGGGGRPGTTPAPTRVPKYNWETGRVE